MTKEQELELEFLKDLHFRIQAFYNEELKKEIPEEMWKVIVTIKERTENVIPWHPTPEELKEL